MLKDNIHATSEAVPKPDVRAAWWPGSMTIWSYALLIGLVALLPRCLGLATFTTIDESYHWPGRVARFAAALSAGDWAATNQTGHPGVTTMWLGALGRWLAARWGVPDPGWAGGGLEYIAMLRLPLAVANSLAVVLGYLLLRRCVRPGVALLAALLWATAPFIVAHSRLLHLDGLLTSFVTLSLLSLLQIIGERTTSTQQRTTGKQPAASSQHPVIVSSCHRVTGWIALSGMWTGLSLLTKGPALILLPVAGLLLLFWTKDEGPRTKKNVTRSSVLYRLSSIVYRPVMNYALWLGVAALVVVLAWPAMWVAPRAALGSVLGEVLLNGGAPEPAGNYFLGQPVADPGPLFYPAVVLWRTTPLTLLGLLALPLVWRRRRTNDEGRTASSVEHSHRVIMPSCHHVITEQRTLMALLFFAIFFTVALSIGPKKYDRYLLPIWPSLEILAAAGLVKIADAVKNREPRTENHPMRGRVLGSWFLVLTISVAQLTWYYPYYLGYFNPLLGGGHTGQYVMLAGWGEGMEQVGGWLRARPDLRAGPVLSWIYPTLAPFVPKEVPVKDLRAQYLDERTSYVVLYSRSVQRKENAEAEAYVRQFPPLFRFTAHGIDYATVHQLPRPFADPVNATFGAELRLRGFSTAQLGSTLVITPSWSIQADGPGGRFAFVHLLDEQGQKVAQVDAPLDQGMFAAWQAGQQFDSPFPLALPAALPPGRYRVVLGVYDPASGARLPMQGGTPLPESVDGPEVLELTQITRIER